MLVSSSSQYHIGLTTLWEEVQVQGMGGSGGGRGLGRRTTSQVQGYSGPFWSGDQPKGSHYS